MAERFTGFRDLEVSAEVINSLYEEKTIELWDKRIAVYPNLYLELKDVANEKHTGLARVMKDGRITLVKTSYASELKPRNREQVFALDALLNDNISVVVLTGCCGSGKTLLALAAAMEKLDKGTYDKIILTRPMSEVGKYKLGALPGDANEKFGPYLLNYMTNLEYFAGSKWGAKELLAQGQFEIIPIQLMRGASFNNCFIIADEVQVLGHTEILTIGTRVGENSKIVVLGDLSQRDENITKEKTGIYKLVNDKRMRESPLAAAIELQVNERSETARLFSQVFEDSDDTSTKGK